MFDAPMGYHQLAVALASQEKLAFQGVDAIKWTYNVMPFGPTNGPAIFVSFIYDIDSVWKKLTTSHGVLIGDTMNTRIIINDIVSWLSTVDYALEYIRCQLKVCQPYRLSLNLRKSHFFPEHFKFVGINVCAKATGPQNPSTTFCLHGQPQSLSVTWQNSSAFASSTLVLFIILSFALLHYASSPSMNIPTPLNRSGRMLLTPCGRT
jgi:hypothetical protein